MQSNDPKRPAEPTMQHHGCLPVLNANPQAARVAVLLRTMRLVFETYKLVSGIPPPSCSPHSLFSHSGTHGGGESIKLLPGAFSCPSSYFRASILAKNLCQPTCWHVFKRRPRAGERRAQARKIRHVEGGEGWVRRWRRRKGGKGRWERWRWKER